MKNIKRLFTVLFCTIFLCSCGTEDADTKISSSDTELQTSGQEKSSDSAEYRKISAEEAHDMMADADDYILLDVRTDEEYKENRIDSAILIPDYEIIDRADSELPDKDALILIYCRSGRRSGNVARQLVEMGYTNVYDFGGIIDWSYETTNG